MFWSKTRIIGIPLHTVLLYKGGIHFMDMFSWCMSFEDIQIPHCRYQQGREKRVTGFDFKLLIFYYSFSRRPYCLHEMFLSKVQPLQSKYKKKTGVFQQQLACKTRRWYRTYNFSWCRPDLSCPLHDTC